MIAVSKTEGNNKKYEREKIDDEEADKENKNNGFSGKPERKKLEINLISDESLFCLPPQHLCQTFLLH